MLSLETAPFAGYIPWHQIASWHFSNCLWVLGLNPHMSCNGSAGFGTCPYSSLFFSSTIFAGLPACKHTQTMWKTRQKWWSFSEPEFPHCFSTFFPHLCKRLPQGVPFPILPSPRPFRTPGTLCTPHRPCSTALRSSRCLPEKWKSHGSLKSHIWLVVSTPLKNISWLGWLFPILFPYHMYWLFKDIIWPMAIIYGNNLRFNI